MALTVLLLVATALTAAAQEVIVGTVTDDVFNEPVMGANVVLVNKQDRYVKGTVTDMDGNFSIQVPEDSKNLTLRVSYIGMKPFNVKYTGQKRVDVVLSEDDKRRLNEVVVRTGETLGEVRVVRGLHVVGPVVVDAADANQKIVWSRSRSRDLAFESGAY